jgi:hypothetical protein
MQITVALILFQLAEVRRQCVHLPFALMDLMIGVPVAGLRRWDRPRQEPRDCRPFGAYTCRPLVSGVSLRPNVQPPRRPVRQLCIYVRRRGRQQYGQQ